MPDSHRTGRLGEDAAAELAIDRGWQIIARNHRMKRGEADLVGLRERDGLKQGMLAEVKSSRRQHVDLSARVNADKRRRMFEMADQLIAEHNLDEVHVVIVEVRVLRDRQELLWIELDAF